MWRFFIVKFHIVQAGESLEMIKKKYHMDDKEYEYHIKGDLSKRTYSKIAINKRGFVIGMNVKINSVGAGISIPTFTFY